MCAVLYCELPLKYKYHAYLSEIKFFCSRGIHCLEGSECLITVPAQYILPSMISICNLTMELNLLQWKILSSAQDTFYLICIMFRKLYIIVQNKNSTCQVSGSAYIWIKIWKLYNSLYWPICRKYSMYISMRREGDFEMQMLYMPHEGCSPWEEHWFALSTL